jgi:hypothetical protein
MTDPTGYSDSPNTTDPTDGGNLVDGTTGHNRSDRGELDMTTLTTDDDAQREDAVVRPGNEPD